MFRFPAAISLTLPANRARAMLQRALRSTHFDTTIGRCSLVWSDAGIVCVQLPELDDMVADARLARRHPGAIEAQPPDYVRGAIAAMVSLLRGARTDLRDLVLDMERVPQFDCRVYAAARDVLAGSTVSYGEIADRLGDRHAARAVGQALGRNPFPIIVPCHRVLSSSGKIGGFSAYGGSALKTRLLTIEGAMPDLPLSLFD